MWLLIRETQYYHGFPEAGHSTPSRMFRSQTLSRHDTGCVIKTLTSLNFVLNVRVSVTTVVPVSRSTVKETPVTGRQEAGVYFHQGRCPESLALTQQHSSKVGGPSLLPISPLLVQPPFIFTRTVPSSLSTQVIE